MLRRLLARSQINRFAGQRCPVRFPTSALPVSVTVSFVTPFCASININRLVAGRVIGLASVVREINDHVCLGDDVGHMPAVLRQIGGEPFAAQFHLRVVHAHVAAINHLAFGQIKIAGPSASISVGGRGFGVRTTWVVFVAAGMGTVTAAFVAFAATAFVFVWAHSIPLFAMASNTMRQKFSRSGFSFHRIFNHRAHVV